MLSAMPKNASGIAGPCLKTEFSLTWNVMKFVKV